MTNNYLIEVLYQYIHRPGISTYTDPNKFKTLPKTLIRTNLDDIPLSNLIMTDIDSNNK